MDSVLTCHICISLNAHTMAPLVLPHGMEGITAALERIFLKPKYLREEIGNRGTWQA